MPSAFILTTVAAFMEKSEKRQQKHHKELLLELREMKSTNAGVTTALRDLMAANEQTAVGSNTTERQLDLIALEKGFEDEAKKNGKSREYSRFAGLSLSH